MQRIRELKVQAENGTNGTKELDAIQREVNERVTTIKDVADATKFNGNSILLGGSNYTIQSGADNGQTTTFNFASGSAGVGVDIDITAVVAGSLTEGAIALDTLQVGGSVTSQDGSASTETGTLADIDTMLDNLSRMRSYVGAVQNSLESKLEYVGVAFENASASRSRVKDVDVAKESSIMIRNQILQQSSAAMLSQANQTPQLALSLLP